MQHPKEAGYATHCTCSCQHPNTPCWCTLFRRIPETATPLWYMINTWQYSDIWLKIGQIRYSSVGLQAVIFKLLAMSRSLSPCTCYPKVQIRSHYNIIPYSHTIYWMYICLLLMIIMFTPRNGNACPSTMTQWRSLSWPLLGSHGTPHFTMCTTHLLTWESLHQPSHIPHFLFLWPTKTTRWLCYICKYPDSILWMSIETQLI